ncbi:MscS Mechanosensitive ion channel [Pseudopedobacter saltans DSM 12145]|uniref:MscS Mechanosensitive ion channel n=1 Tax=Pseudopedobacter saltans (strain ATCC 51119 / DSM 12145 / JCM 21818 / CCUG 39354 / LMG 10337 / NBRC 100064 / NCIMB 13643) TaxID=762903 RepID=F0S6J5_PSESL|nr:mechanosensitive ion channel domain-containing protein [Pseudopedobacter saltans]ADY51071.1 MscS Mechanosensitive ion channel [Pseudopedobacter saltans DSM 12145]
MPKLKESERSTFREISSIILKLILCVVLIYFSNQPPLWYKTVPILAKLVYSVMIFFSVSLSVSILRYFVVNIYIRKNKLKSSVKDNFILGINQIVSVLNTVFFIVALMYFLGINPIKFITSITIVAAAIALLSKEYISNMINGLIIMFADKLSLGDHIKVGNEEGKIVDITLLNVILQNEDNDMVVIPNSVIFNSVIINQSKQNVKKLTVEFEVDVSKKFTAEFLEEQLAVVLKDYKGFVVEDGFSVKTIFVKKDLVHFKVQVILNHYDKLRERKLRKELYHIILQIIAK